MHCPNTGDVFCLSGRAEDIWSPRWAVGTGFVPVGSPHLQFLFINSLLVNSWKRWQNLHFCYWFWTFPTKAGHLVVWTGSTGCSWAHAGESGTPSPESPCGVWRFLSQSAQAAVTKYHRLCSLHNTLSVSIVLEAASPGRVRFWWEHLPGLQLAAYLLCPHAAERESLVSLVKVTQSCPTLCDPVDYSPPGSSIHGISQARILEWVWVQRRWPHSTLTISSEPYL